MKDEYTSSYAGYTYVVYDGRNVDERWIGHTFIKWYFSDIPENASIRVAVSHIRPKVYNKLAEHSFNLLKPMLDNKINFDDADRILDMSSVRRLREIYLELQEITVTAEDTAKILEIASNYKKLSIKMIQTVVSENSWLVDNFRYIPRGANDNYLRFVSKIGYAFTYHSDSDETLNDLTEHLKNRELIREGLTKNGHNLFYSPSTSTSSEFLNYGFNKNLRWWLKKFSPKHLKVMSTWVIENRHSGLNSAMFKELIEAYVKIEKHFDNQKYYIFQDQYVNNYSKRVSTGSAFFVNYRNIRNASTMFSFATFACDDFSFSDRDCFYMDMAISLEKFHYTNDKKRIDNLETSSPFGMFNQYPANLAEIEVIALRVLLKKTNIDATFNAYYEFLENDGNFFDFIRYVLSYDKYNGTPIPWLLTLGLEN